MNDVELVIETIESTTGLKNRGNESFSEYLDRLADEFNPTEEELRWLQELNDKEQFTSDNKLSEKDRQQLQQICHALVSGTESQTGPTSKRISLTTSPETAVIDRKHSSVSNQDGSSGVSTQSTLSLINRTNPSASSTATRVISGTSGTEFGALLKAISARLTAVDAAYLLPLIAGGIYVFFYNLGGFPLGAMDEGFYGNLARHMVQDGYWIVPHMYYRIGVTTAGFEPWVRLPPLGVWLQAVSMMIFGVNEFAVRFPTAVASVLTVVLAYLIGRSFVSRRAGFIAGLVYLTSPYAYAGFNGGRDGGLDVLMILFGSLFIYTAWLAVKRENPRWLYLMGVFGGLAVLTKGFGAGVFLIAALPLVFFNQRIFFSKEMAYSIVLTLCLVLPWPLYMYSLYGDGFVEQFFVRYVFDRAAGAAFGANTNTLFSFMEYPYIKQFLFHPDMFHPWSFIFLFGLGAYVYSQISDDEMSYLDSGMLVWWALTVLVLFVFIGNKAWYIFPMYLPASVLVGAVIDYALDGRGSATGAVALGVVALIAISSEYSLDPDAQAYVTNGVVLTVGALVVIWARPIQKQFSSRFPRLSTDVVPSILPAVVAIILIFSLVGVPPADYRDAQQEALAVELNDHATESETVFIESQMAVPFHTFSFEAQRPMESGSLSELRMSSARYAVVTEESLSEITAEKTILMNTTIQEDQNVSLIEFQR